MRVFKTGIRILLRNFQSLVIYLVIFFALTISMGKMYAKQMENGFASEKPKYTLINEDRESALYEGFADYLARYGTAVEVKDELRSLQDALFYEETRYILRIPAGFADGIMSGEPVVMDETMKKDSADGYLLGVQTDQYWNLIRNCRGLLPEASEEEISRRALESLSKETEVRLYEAHAKQVLPDTIYATLRVMMYMILVISALIIGTLQLAFFRTDLNLRNQCAPLSSAKKNMQIFLSAVVTILVLSVGMLLATGMLYHQTVGAMDTKVLLLVVANFALLVLNATAIGMIAGMFVKTVNGQNLIANFLSLALAFLCGGMVPLEYMASSVRTIAKFLPPYWYAAVLEELHGLQELGALDVTKIGNYLLVQLFFAAALFAVVLVIGKYRSRGEESISRAHTETI